MSDSLWLHGPARPLCPWDFPGKNIGMDCHFLPQGIFLSQGSNPSLLNCRWILYHWVTRKEHICSVHLLSCVWLFENPWTAECKAFLSITNSRVCSNSCPSSWWCHPTISSSVVPFSSRLQSFPASGSFPMSQFFTSGGQIIGVSVSASVFPMNIQDWFTLGFSDLISLLSKGLSRVFSNGTVRKHQFCVAQLPLWSNSHSHSWLPEKTYLWLDGPLSAK